MAYKEQRQLCIKLEDVCRLYALSIVTDWSTQCLPLGQFGMNGDVGDDSDVEDYDNDFATPH